MRSRIGVVLAEVETTYGVDPSPLPTADAVQVFEPEVDPQTDTLERSDLAHGLSKLKELGGKRRINFSFMTELRGSGAAGTAPRGVSALFKACAMSEAISAGVSVTYAPVSSSFQSCTIYLYMDGKLYQIQGCVGTFEIVLTAGERGMVKWTMSGLYETPTDAAVPSSPTYDTTVPVVCKNLVATFDAFAAIIREIMLKLNNKITERADLTGVHGVRGFDVVDRNPDGEISLEATVLATKNWYTKYEADTVQVLSVVVGAVAGNICAITANQCRIRQIPEKDEDGIRVHPIPFQLSRSSMNDELSIVFT